MQLLFAFREMADVMEIKEGGPPSSHIIPSYTQWSSDKNTRAGASLPESCIVMGSADMPERARPEE